MRTPTVENLSAYRILVRVHLNEEILEAYEQGHMAEPAIAAVEQHLLICETCRQLADLVREYVNARRAGLGHISEEQD